jgi:GT2 family glycosyltransferase
VNVRSLEVGERLGAQRGEVVVLVPVHGAHDHLLCCLRSLLAHTPAEVAILICDDASPDRRSEAFLGELAAADASEHRISYMRRATNAGFPANVNAGLAAAAPADVVVLNSDCVVAEGWLQGLREAAHSDSTVATATALTNHGSIVSLPARGRPGRLPLEWTVDQAAAAIRRRSLRLHPRLPTAIGHCIWIRRSALELVGDLDLAFSPGYGEEVDFSLRCVEQGLCHVLADDVFVLHEGGGSFSAAGSSSPLQQEHERMIRARYPYYHASVREIERDVASPLARSLSVARRTLAGTSVLIDGRILVGPTTGTQLHALELIGAIARTGRARVSVLMPEEPSPAAQQALARLDGVRTLGLDAALEDGRRFDIVHRPFQVGDEQDLALLSRLGERIAVTQQDLIGYHNPAYFHDFGAWAGYRRTTRTALAIADRVIFFSEHARRQALAEDLVEPGRTAVIHIGVDHVVSVPVGAPVAPRGAWEPEAGEQMILCIGTDFRHKNRAFAVRVLEALRRHHGWSGRLVLAGPSVTRGSSAPQEARLLALSPQTAGAVVRLGAVSEAEKAWLYERAHLVIYPTIHEGFGLVPFEAADHDRPCAWAPGTSLSEVLPDEAAAIVAWSAEETAERILPLLRDPAAREANLQAIRAAGAAHGWEAMGSRLMDLYEELCDGPATPAARLFAESSAALSLSRDAFALVGPGGALPAEAERPLLALATHPLLGAPVFGLLRAAYRAGYRANRLRARRRPGAPLTPR